MWKGSVQEGQGNGVGGGESAGKETEEVQQTLREALYILPSSSEKSKLELFVQGFYSITV